MHNLLWRGRSRRWRGCDFPQYSAVRSSAQEVSSHYGESCRLTSREREYGTEDLTSARSRSTRPRTPQGPTTKKLHLGRFSSKRGKTWDVPPSSQQMEALESFVPIGKGGIFVPHSPPQRASPRVLVLDSIGHTVISGNPCRTFSVEPGAYTVVLGSAAHQQRIVRKVTVRRRTVPIMPDWAGLARSKKLSIRSAFRSGPQ